MVSFPEEAEVEAVPGTFGLELRGATESEVWFSILGLNWPGEEVREGLKAWPCGETW